MSNTEIVVVGAGVAGLSAALAVAGTGHDVTLVTKPNWWNQTPIMRRAASPRPSSPTTTRSCTPPTPWPSRA